MIRPKVVLEQLLRPSALSPHRLKQLAHKPVGGGERHLYTPSEVRQIRLALDEESRNKGRNKGRAKAEPPSGPKVLNVRMSKGGVGKTTIAGNVAAAMALMGYRVLVIDGDPQASMTRLLGVDPSLESIRHIGHLMQENVTRDRRIDFQSAVFPIYPGGMLDLIPADITLTQADVWLLGQIGRDTVFDRLVKQHPEFFGNYDLVVVDSAPGTTPLALNFMVASDILMPIVWLDRENLTAISGVASNIQEVNQAIPGKHLVPHIVANGYHSVYSHCREVLGILRASFPGNVDETVIPHSTEFVKQQAVLPEDAKGPLAEKDPLSFEAQHIYELARGLITQYNLAPRRMQIDQIDESALEA